MVRLPLLFVASFLSCLVNSSVVVGRSFLKRATEEEICGAADYFICSDGATCCPNGFLCEGDGCVKAPDTTTNDPSNTDVVITVTVTASPKNTVLSTGAIAGIAVGGVILLAALGVAIFFCMRKRKIGKEVLKAYEDPNRNMYDQVVVEGKRISVVPVGSTTATQRRQTQTQTQLSPPSEAQEFEGIEGTSEIAVGLETQPEDHYSQQQYQHPQQYQTYQQQPQQVYYKQGQEQIPQSTDLSAGQPYPPEQSAPSYDPIPDSLRVGSPISPIRADSMGLIPVGVDSADGGQHPYQFSPVPGMIRHHSTPLPPPPHLTTEPMPVPHSTSPPPQTPTPSSPVYYQSPSPPPQITSPQTLGGYYTPQTYTQQGAPMEPPPPNNRYSQYPQYQQYPPPPEPVSSPVSPIQPNKRYSIHPGGQDPRRTGTGHYSDWGQL